MGLEKLSENQLKVIKDKYLRGDTLEKWLRGVTHNIALAELLYSDEIDKKKIFENVSYKTKDNMYLLHHGLNTYDERHSNFKKFIGNLDRLSKEDSKAREIVSKYENEFYDMLSNFEFLPNSPTLMNAGRQLQQLSACFVLPVEDSIEGWGKTIMDTMSVHKSGGGTGFSFSKIRPNLDLVKSTKGIASGPLSPMRIIDKATAEVKQGGTRRGANMGILRIDHPDILDFIKAKSKKNELENFNISVALTKEFMNACENGEEYNLVNPRNNKVVKSLDAREVFDLIAKSAHETADPGIIFMDRINEYNPTPDLGMIERTNPCGEQPLLPYESCNLGSISLPKFIKDGKINYNKLEKCVKKAVRFLDNVLDVNNLPLPEIEEITKSNRKIGLGIMGWAESLIKMEISYNSEEGIRKGEEVMKFIDDSALNASKKLAEVRGVFPNHEKSIYKGKIKLRHASRTTIAPTGTIAITAGLQGSGIEPLFSIAYTRYNAAGLDALKEGKKPNENDVFYEYNSLFKEMAEKNEWFGFENESELWGEISHNHGSVKGIKKIPRDIQKLFATSHDIEPERHIKMQAAFQKYTNNAVSKTINFRKGTGVEKVKEAYMFAYKEGLKGITIYVDGSKDLQVLNLEDKVYSLPQKRPKILIGITRRERYGQGNKLYVTKNYYLPLNVFNEMVGTLKEKGIPYEIFGNSSQFDSKDFTAMTAHGKAMSKMLQSNIPLEEVAGIYIDLPDGTLGWEKGYVNKSIEDALAHAVLDYPIKKEKNLHNTLNNENPQVIMAPCPDCGSIDYIVKREGGCIYNSCCNYSPKCS